MLAGQCVLQPGRHVGVGRESWGETRIHATVEDQDHRYEVAIM